MIAIAKTTTGPTSSNSARRRIKLAIVLVVRVVEEDLVDEGYYTSDDTKDDADRFEVNPEFKHGELNRLG